MTKKIAIVGAGSQVLLAATQRLLDNSKGLEGTRTGRFKSDRTMTEALMRDGEAFMRDGEEVIDPDRVRMLDETIDLSGVEEHIRRIYVKAETISEPPGDGLPNRMCIERSSPFYTNCGAYVGVRLDGEEQANTVEFNVVEGWIRIGKADSRGRVTMWDAKEAKKTYGKVEVYWRYSPSRQVRRQISRIGK